MRHGRAKAARKTLKFFQLNNPSIKPPYKVLLDGNFLAAAMKQKVPIVDRIRKTLQNEEFSFFICRSALEELKVLLDSTDGGSEMSVVLEQAWKFGLDECEIIEKDSIPILVQGDKKSHNDNEDDTNSKEEEEEQQHTPSLDIQALVTYPPPSTTKKQKHNDSNNNQSNPQGFIIATQDTTLSDTLRFLPYIPQMRLSRGVLLLESPSTASRKDATSMERGKQSSGGGMMSEQEKMLVDRMWRKEKKRRREEGIVAASGNGGEVKRKRKAKEPNPLSCKKKKVDGGKGKGKDEVGDGKKKRRRRKKSNVNTSSDANADVHTK